MNPAAVRNHWNSQVTPSVADQRFDRSFGACGSRFTDAGLVHLFTLD
jgi:hypothetical protein